MKTFFAGLFALFLTTGSGLAFETPSLVTIPAGEFIFGSDQKQREYGYQLDEKAYGHSVTRQDRKSVV